MDCKCELVDGEVKINGEFDVVFIYFMKSMFCGIYIGLDVFLKFFVDKYVDWVKKFGGFDLWVDFIM